VRLQEIVIEVSGMSGPDAENTVAAALRRLPGVQSVHVDTREKRVVVTGDPHLSAPEALRVAVQSAGFAVDDVWFAE
jgi:copper chaperone CopZ